MFKTIKQNLRKIILSDFVLNEEIKKYPFNLKAGPSGYFKTFGSLNPDKIFYIIWRDQYGSGFFSNLQHVLAHLKFADMLGMIPVIDFSNFKTLYNELCPVNGSTNAWEYYFEKVSPFSLEEVYQSKNVYFCNGDYSWSMGSYNSDSSFFQIYLKYINPKKCIIQKVEEIWDTFGATNKILGIHFRGKEQNVAKGHPFCPTRKQILKCTDNILSKYGISNIFLVTEEKENLDSFIGRYGKMVLYTNSYRTYRTNAYKIIPRSQHRYLLGEEIMIEAFLLAKCCGLLYSSSNVSAFAIFLNNNKYEYQYFIQNGVNSNNALIAKYLYSIKRYLPSQFGGLLDNVEFKENKYQE